VRWLSSGGIGEKIDGSFMVLYQLLICVDWIASLARFDRSQSP
jgi:hypothetical protein